MQPKTRARLLWAMASLVLVYALVNVIVYFASGRFGMAWFVASLAIYGAALVGALVLLAADRRASDVPTLAAIQVTNVQATQGPRGAMPSAQVSTTSAALVPVADDLPIVADDRAR